MSFATQVRQVMRHDAREARWFLVVLAVLLIASTLQGLDPGGRWNAMESPLGAGGLLLRAAVMLAAGVITLTFLPGDGPRAAWRVLPITPRAVWVARFVWGAVLLGAVSSVCLLVLATIPLDVSVRVAAAGNVMLVMGRYVVAAVLVTLAAGSRRYVLVLVPVTGITALVAYAFLAVTGLPEPFGRALRWLTTTPGSIALLSLGALLASWPFLVRSRTATPRWVAFIAAVLLLSVGRSDEAHAALGPGIVREAAPLVETASLRVTLDTTTRTVYVPRAEPLDTSTFSSEQSLSVDWPHARLRLEPVLVSRASTDRIVWRPRRVWLGDSQRDSLPLNSTIAVTAVPGVPVLPGVGSWRNAPAAEVPFASVSVARDRVDEVRRIGQTASLTLEVERQRSTVLTSLPLGDAGAPSGPWARMANARLVEIGGRPLVRAETVLLRGPRTDGRTTAGAGLELTFALVNPSAGDAVHLVARANRGTRSSWMLDPSLFQRITFDLEIVPDGLPFTQDSLGRRVHEYPDVAWLRAASLAVIGWEAVERGPLTLAAPITDRVSTR